MSIKNTIARLGLVGGLWVSSAGANPLPEDEYISELYQYYCMACHASAESGAPLTGDRKAWESRVKQGLEQLLNNTIEGVRAMPALGSCSDCTGEDFEALIVFMSGMREVKDE